MKQITGPIQNTLLRCLKRKDFELLRPALEPVTFKTGTTLFEPGEDVEFAFFPGPGTLVALVAELEDDPTTEAAMIGREGALGGIISEGYKPAFARGVVQIGGPGHRLPLKALAKAQKASPVIRDHFARYADCLLAQVLQSVACNAVHEFDARLARWLLSVQDRIGAHSLKITHEFVADMLGVKRPYASRIINKLARTKTIRNGRGTITILDRKRLEKQSCECYLHLRRHFERLIPHCYPIFAPRTRLQ